MLGGGHMKNLFTNKAIKNENKDVSGYFCQFCSDSCYTSCTRVCGGCNDACYNTCVSLSAYLAK